MENRLFLNTVTAALFAAVLSACLSKASPVFAQAGSPPIELDAAIREASDYLNGKVPKGSKAVFLNIKSDYPDLSEYILSVLSEYAVNDGVFSVVDRQQLDTIRAELNFQMSGEVSDESAQSIGQMLGAQSIVSGAVSKIGPLYRMQVKAIEVQSARVQGQWSRNVPTGATIAALTENYAPAVTGPASIPAVNSARPSIIPPAAPAPPALIDGTYRFNPRIQAFQGARAVHVYLDRIVVRRGYMTIYIINTPEGDGSGYGSSLIGSWKNASLKDMDNNRSGRLVQAVPSGPPFGSVCAYDLSYQNITGTRLTLTSTDNPPIEFYDIVLEQPDD
ncbi:MAG: penicillin-binding protein activator LpoB [Treponema sp.]|nr:penicillin-binding protein activator LpoB [Treponema sp.]